MKKTSPTIQVKPDPIKKQDLPPHQRAPEVTKIRTSLASQEYKDGWDRIWGKKDV